MVPLSAAFFIWSVEWRTYAIRITRNFSWRHPYQRYNSCVGWKSVELFGIRFYWDCEEIAAAKIA